MSKQDKDRSENLEPAELAADAVMSEREPEALLRAATEPELNPAQAEQSRQFNSWLDRALPRLMEYLGQGATSAVTSPGNKAKH